MSGDKSVPDQRDINQLIADLAERRTPEDMQELCRRLPTLTLFVQLHVFQEDFPTTPAKAPRYGTKPLRLPSGQDLIQLFVDPNDPRLQPKYGTFSAEQALYMGGIPPLQGVVLHNNQSSSMIIFIPELKEIYKQAFKKYGGTKC